MNQPLVSIIITTYNRADLLREAIDSVLSQSYKPIEIIVIDDGSTDHSKQVVDAYRDKVKYFYEDNHGVAYARNLGCKVASGELIAFHDDDDIMLKHRIQVLYEAISRYPEAVFAVGKYKEIDNNCNYDKKTSLFNLNHNGNTLIINDAYKTIIWPKVTATPLNTIFRASIAKKIQFFDTAFYHGCEDTDFFARLALEGPIVCVPKVVSYVRRHPGSLTDNYLKSNESKLLLLDKHLTLLGNKDHALKARLRKRLYYFYKEILINMDNYLNKTFFRILPLSRHLFFFDKCYLFYFITIRKLFRSRS